MILQGRIGKSKKNDDKQKKCYSEKPKIDRFKNQIVIIEKAGKIVGLIVGERGAESDIKLLKKTKKKLNIEQSFQGNNGY